MTYSNDLRWRVVYQHMFLHWSRKRIADAMAVSMSTVGRIVRAYERYGDIWHPNHYNKRPSGPPRLLSVQELDRLVEWMTNDPTYTLDQLQMMLLK